MTERLGVAIVGGGPAGAALAARLAAARPAGRRPRALGPLALAGRRRVRVAGRGRRPCGGSARTRRCSATVARPIPAMRVETPAGATVPPDLRRGRRGRAGGRLRPVAAGPVPARAGRRGRRRRPAGMVGHGGRSRRRRARRPATRMGRRRPSPRAVVVGADGPHSVVARAAGVARPARLAADRVDLSPRRPGPGRAPATRGCGSCRDGYVGIAPVAGGRVNVGIVLGRSWRAALARDGARSVADAIVAAIPPTDEDPARGASCRPTDELRRRLAARSPRDPSGRAGLAARRRRGRLPRPVHRRGHPPRPRVGRAGGRRDLRQRSRPDRRLRRLRARDAASVPRQGRRVVARPGVPRRGPSLFEYAARRVAARPTVRATMGLVMGDLVPAGRALDPRYLGRAARAVTGA